MNRLQEYMKCMDDMDSLHFVTCTRYDMVVITCTWIWATAWPARTRLIAKTLFDMETLNWKFMYVWGREGKALAPKQYRSAIKSARGGWQQNTQEKSAALVTYIKGFREVCILESCA